MAWKVVAASGEEELQKQLDQLQARLPRRDEHGELSHRRLNCRDCSSWHPTEGNNYRVGERRDES